MIDNRTAPYAALLLRVSLGVLLLAQMLVIQALLGDGAHAWRPSFLPGRFVAAH